MEKKISKLIKCKSIRMNLLMDFFISFQIFNSFLPLLQKNHGPGAAKYTIKSSDTTPLICNFYMFWHERWAALPMYKQCNAGPVTRCSGRTCEILICCLVMSLCSFFHLLTVSNWAACESQCCEPLARPRHAPGPGPECQRYDGSPGCDFWLGP